MSSRRFGVALLIVLLVPMLTHGQQAPEKPSGPPPKPGTLSVEESTAITQVWALLAQGIIDKATIRAAEVLAAYPRSAAALTVMVEAEIARTGAQAALSHYERWVGVRPEEPGVLRRIAIAWLRENVAEGKSGTARLEALRALAADGDAIATAELATASAAGGLPEARVLAALGNESSVKVLVTNLKSGTGNALTIIEALGESGSKAAVSALTGQLKHQFAEIRGAAVEALGRLGNRFDVKADLQPLLSDQSSYVRIKAASALFRLGDTSGASMLRDLMQEDSDKSRLIGLQSTATQPDATWIQDVRRLTSSTEPEIRVQAAKLLAPHDPEYARAILTAALNDANPAIRDMAAESFTEVASNDLRTLRQLLKAPDRIASVRAAARILMLLR
jgi:HEAT repeat protein